MRRAALLAVCALLVCALPGGCPGNAPADDSGDPTSQGGNSNTNGSNGSGGGSSNDSGSGKVLGGTWSAIFDAGGGGVLSGVWGSSASDVFFVGGTPTQGEVYHFDGTVCRGMKVPAGVGLLVWVFGFGPADVYAVGVGGGAIHYDGVRWTKLETGTTQDLWGVWGRASNDLWVVGGSGGVEPVLLHFDGTAFTSVAPPANDRAATALFKIWGIGSKLFAVGERGLIVEFDGQAWKQVATGAAADDDFVSLWGTSERNIVAVGGRSSARIATFDGSQWTTIQPAALPGLNAVCMVSAGEAIVGGVDGFVGRFDVATRTVTRESSGSSLVVHAIWGKTADRFFGVGGRFSAPFTGLALVRLLDGGRIENAPPPLPIIDDEPPPVHDCNGNGVEDATDISQRASADCDADGVPDECQADSDGDGVPDACDRCGAGNDADDADGDGVPDACDACAGGNDGADADGDGVADGCDRCAGHDDGVDADGDGVPDGCDKCAGGDDRLDADGDGVPDTCDVCAGSDDRLDTDGDGVPNGCDDCAGDNQSDADGDGVPDACDVCAGSDDHADADGDGKPDGCDTCPQDAADDSDGDGVCDSLDRCQGSDDAIDVDADGTPDGCDCFESECALGQKCVGGACVDTSDPDLEIGNIRDGTCNVSAYEKLLDYGDLRVCCGFQGLADLYMHLRVTGFTQDAAVEIRPIVTLATGEVISSPNLTIFKTLSWNVAGGFNEVSEVYVMLIWPRCDLHAGREATLSLEIRQSSDPNVRASLTLPVRIVAGGDFCNDCP
ncbi:MAG: hypothetical protein CHACPFDD_04009 [Phycisphaerae bacterium]|nr:hypothetical protein [Phycisphaerae bacterium]